MGRNARSAAIYFGRQRQISVQTVDRGNESEQSVPGYDPQLVAMQSLSLAAKVYTLAVGRA
jgi:hypothetical protein